MASYSMEDIELIRRKSDVSYEEAVTMLDYHSGNVARVLDDLERSGRMKKESKGNPVQGKERSKFMNFVSQLYRTRVKVKKDDTVIINLSVIFMVLAVLMLSPHLVLVGLLLGLVFGYRISIDKDDEAFRSDSVESLVHSAADNVKNAVNGISREINHAVEKKQARKEEKKADEAAANPVNESVNDSADMKTDMAENTKAEEKAEAEITVEAENETMPLSTRMPDLNAGIVRDLEKDVEGSGVPRIQIPVRVESNEGTVEVETGDDGYHTATIG